MGALSELLKRPDSAATPATSATRPPESGAESQESQESRKERKRRTKQPILGVLMRVFGDMNER